MNWPNIFLSLREALATKQSQSGYGKFVYPREKYIWAPVRILHETEKAILINGPGMTRVGTKTREHGKRLRSNYLKRKKIIERHCSYIRSIPMLDSDPMSLIII